MQNPKNKKYKNCNNSFIIFNNKITRPFSQYKKAASNFGQTSASFSSNQTIYSSKSLKNNKKLTFLKTPITPYLSNYQSKNVQKTISQYLIAKKPKTIQQAIKFQKQNPPLMTFFNDKVRTQYNKVIVDSYFIQQTFNPNNIQQEQCYSPTFTRSKNNRKNYIDLLKTYKNKNQYKRAIHTAQIQPTNINDKGYFNIQLNHIQADKEEKKDNFQNVNNINAHENSTSIIQKSQSTEKQLNSQLSINEHEDTPKRAVSQYKGRIKQNLSIKTVKPKQMLAFINTNSNVKNSNQFESSFSEQVSNFSKKYQGFNDYFLDLEKQRQNQLDFIKKLSFSKPKTNKYFYNKLNETFKKININPNEISICKIKNCKIKNNQIFERQEKIDKLNVIPFLWSQGQFENSKLYAKSIQKKSLRKQLYKIVRQKRGEQDIFIIYPNQQYRKLFLNQNQWLIDLIVCIAKQFKSVQGKVVHPKININNIYRIREKEVMIDDWGYSAVKQTLKVVDKQWSTCSPLLIGEQNEWLVIPEYLAPQMILDYLNDWKSQEIWSTPSGTNIWNLGCLIFQILTLIPLWIPYRCQINSQQQLKKGLLSVQRRTPQQVSIKHKLFIPRAQKIVKKSYCSQNYNINPKVIQVMNGCLKMNPKDRITPQKIINTLNSQSIVDIQKKKFKRILNLL